MDELIKKIIEIENKAQSVIKEARDDQDKLDENIAKTIDEIKSDVLSKAEKKCKEIQLIEDSDADNKIAEILKEKEASMAQLNSIYEQKCDEWVNDITAGIINA